jgi:hypothetical protein
LIRRKNPPFCGGFFLFEISFFGCRVAAGNGRGSKEQEPQDGFGKTPQVKGRLIILPVDLGLLVGMDNVSVFHFMDVFECGKMVKKSSHSS